MIAAHIEQILIVTGAATALALVNFIAPLQILHVLFGVTPTSTDTISLALARHW